MLCKCNKLSLLIITYGEFWWPYAARMVRSQENKEFLEFFTVCDGSGASITLLVSSLMKVLCLVIGRQGVCYG